MQSINSYRLLAILILDINLFLTALVGKIDKMIKDREARQNPGISVCVLSPCTVFSSPSFTMYTPSHITGVDKHAAYSYCINSLIPLCS